MTASEILQKKLHSLMAERGFTNNKQVTSGSNNALSNGTLGRIKAGRNVTVHMLDELSKFFNVPLHELLIPDTPAGTLAESANARGPIATDAVSVNYSNNRQGKTALLQALVQFSELAKTGIEPPKRRLLAQMVGSMFEDGPSDDTTQAIDAFTRQLDRQAAAAALTARESPALDVLIPQGAAQRAFAEAFDAVMALKASDADRELLNDFRAAVEQKARLILAADRTQAVRKTLA